MRRFALYLALVAAPVAAAPKAADVEAYRALAVQDLRLAVIGHRLAWANAPFCMEKARNPGWVIHDLAQYPDMETARTAFGRGGAFQIAHVVPNGAAAIAGLQPGDALLRTRSSQAMVDFDAIAVHYGDNRRNRGMDEAISGLRPVFADRFADGDRLPDAPIVVTIRRGSEQREVELRPEPSCATRFWVDSRNKVDAGADGEQVRITSGLMDLASADDELAAAVAHELAHNLLGHRNRLNGLKKGKAKATLETEIEADRLSVWLMANAGYDPAAALRFHERYGRKHGAGIFGSATHHRWRKRVEILRTEIDLMNRTEPKDGLRDPPLLVAYRRQQ